MKNFNKDEIEKIITKNTVIIDGRMTLVGTDFDRLVKDILSLQLGSLEEKEIFNILRDYISKKAIYDDRDLNNIAKSISHLKDKKIEQLKSEIKKLKEEVKRQDKEIVEYLQEPDKLLMKIDKLEKENEKLRYRNEGFIDRR